MEKVGEILRTGHRVNYRELRSLIFKGTYDHAFLSYSVVAVHGSLFWKWFGIFSSLKNSTILVKSQTSPEKRIFEDVL